MPEQHERAGKLDEAEEILDSVFPSSDQSAVVLHPGKVPFHFPTTAVSTKGTPVLGLAFAVDTDGRDHLDTISTHLLVQRVRVLSLVADQAFRQLVEETAGQNSFHKPALGV